MDDSQKVKRNPRVDAECDEAAWSTILDKG